MHAKYLIRLDDACHTMNNDNWIKLERLLDFYCIKPIAAVVPDNKDKELVKGIYDYNFWEKIKCWENKGWTIGLHGYNHICNTGNGGINPIQQRSEFAGLSFEEQCIKIVNAIKIFRKNKIEPTVFVAPSHTLDNNTLMALKLKSDIRFISDGIAFKPYVYRGFTWVPQQLWNPRKICFGIWTICLHPDSMDEIQFERICSFIKENNKNFISFKDLNCQYRKRSLFDLAFKLFFLARRRWFLKA